jgi:hypothetical protein
MMKTLRKRVKINFGKSCPDGHRIGTGRELQREKIHSLWVVSRKAHPMSGHELQNVNFATLKHTCPDSNCNDPPFTNRRK